jgi:short-chain fatty acids transporter
MLAKVGSVLSRISRRIVPDPFVLALGLTAVVFIGGLVILLVSRDLTWSASVWTLCTGWYQGFKDPQGLTFALQMCLVLVTGHALATTPAVQRFVTMVSRLPKTTPAAALLVAIVACIAGIIHWGLGAIVGALLGREIARSAYKSGRRLHYPLLGAAAYAGLAVWHGGLSGSAPLKVAESGHFLEGLTGVLPMSQTVFAPLNLLVTGTLLVVIPVLFWALAPRKESDAIGPQMNALVKLPGRERPGETGLVAWLQNGNAVGAVVGLSGLLFFACMAAAGRMAFDLNAVNLFFLFLGITLQGGLRHYVNAVADGARGAGAIVLQFPFYFGILGVMQASGLIQLVSGGFAGIASTETFPVLTYFSAGLVNLFVPSGGGQWIVQGEVLIQAGQQLGVAPQTTVMAFAYGDAWTNMLQPFWALPLLGIMGLKARDIIGYTAVIFLAMLILVPLLLLLAA